MGSVTFPALSGFYNDGNQPKIPFMDTGLTNQVAGWTAAATAAIGAVGGAAMLRRKLSRDRTEMTKDRVESEFVTLLLRERDEAIASAREAWRVRQADAESIARLASQNTFQQQEIERLKGEFAAFKRLIARLYPNTRSFLESDFPPPTDFAPDITQLPSQSSEKGELP